MTLLNTVAALIVAGDNMRDGLNVLQSSDEIDGAASMMGVEIERLIREWEKVADAIDPPL